MFIAINTKINGIFFASFSFTFIWEHEAATKRARREKRVRARSSFNLDELGNPTKYEHSTRLWLLLKWKILFTSHGTKSESRDTFADFYLSSLNLRHLVHLFVCVRESFPLLIILALWRDFCGISEKSKKVQKWNQNPTKPLNLLPKTQTICSNKQKTFR